MVNQKLVLLLENKQKIVLFLIIFPLIIYNENWILIAISTHYFKVYDNINNTPIEIFYNI